MHGTQFSFRQFKVIKTLTGSSICRRSPLARWPGQPEVSTPGRRGVGGMCRNQGELAGRGSSSCGGGDGSVRGCPARGGCKENSPRDVASGWAFLALHLCCEHVQVFSRLG